jgi:hypothetical protein
MSYVKTGTAPTFGRRDQALGWYQRGRFPLPTTSMSRVIRTRALGGWFNGPFPVYVQPEFSRTRGQVTPLSGIVSPSAPSAGSPTQGAITYRVDPRTGKYRFFASDLLPRGVWKQKTFQPPARPALSSLGVPLLPAVPTGAIVPGRRSPGFRGRLLPGLRLSGCCDSCSCGGSCSGLSGLGDECSLDSDCGPGGTCGAGVCYSPGPSSGGGGGGFVCPDGSSPGADGTCGSSGPLPPGSLPVCTWDANGNLVPGSPAVCAPRSPTAPAPGPGQRITPPGSPVQIVLSPGNPAGAVVCPAGSSLVNGVCVAGGASGGSLLTSSTNLFGVNVPNIALVLGAGALLVGLGGGKRR